MFKNRTEQQFNIAPFYFVCFKKYQIALGDYFPIGNLLKNLMLSMS
jgi:hypothetical protein